MITYLLADFRNVLQYSKAAFAAFSISAICCLYLFCGTAIVMWLSTNKEITA